MLRIAKPGLEAPSRPLFRRSIVAVLAAAALLVAGLRGPAGDETQVASADEPAADQARQPIDLSYVPSDAVAVVAARPSDLFSQPEFATLAALANSLPDLAKRPEVLGRRISALSTLANSLPELAAGGFKVDRIVEVKFVLLDIGPPFRGPSLARTVIKSAVPVDWKAFMRQAGSEFVIKAQFKGKTYYRKQRGKDDKTRLAWLAPDDKTLIVSAESDIKRLIESGPVVGQPAWLAQWNEYATGQVAIAIDGKKLGPMLREIAAEAPLGDPQAALAKQLAPDAENVEALVVGIGVARGIQVKARAACTSPEAAQKIQAMGAAFLGLAKQGLAAHKADPAANAESEKALLGLIEALLNSARIETDGASVAASAALQNSSAAAARLLADGITAARTAVAARERSANNLKQIGIALHNYEAVHKRLPAAVMKGPTGVPYSWRVAILPYLGAKELYDRYRQDEPWDGEHNKEVLANIPAVFAEPGDGPRSTNTAYVAIAGAAACFAEGEGIRFADITDGLSNTIWVVEKRSEIPWTKPEDVQFDPEKDLPVVGGVFDSGFHACIGDGSVRFIAKDIDPKKLRVILTRAGGEPVQF